MNEKRISGRIERCSGQRTVWLGIALVAGAAILIGCFGEQGRLWLRYDRAGINHWEFWRLLTGHVTHLSFGHIALNLTSLVLLKVLIEDGLRPAEWLLAALGAVIAIDLGLYALSPGIAWYVGLSGALHGIALAGGLGLASRGVLIGWLLCAAIVVKLVFEQAAGPLPFSELSSGGSVVVDAHLYGAAGGGIAWWLSRFLSSEQVRSV